MITEQQLRANISANLRRLRGPETQATIARYAGITQASVSHYEGGNRTPTLMAILRLADAYGVPLDDILSGDRS